MKPRHGAIEPPAHPAWQTASISVLRRVGRWVLLCALLSCCVTAFADWPQFRGNHSDGIGTGSPPVTFGPDENVRWKTPLASGHSSPCISGSRIFVTTCEDQDQPKLSVVCLHRDSGELLWRHTVTVSELEKGHPSFSPASSSPCCDGQSVVAYFGSYGLLCLDHKGTLIWEKRLPLTKSFAGNATSPIIAGDKVILYRGNDVDHYLLCLNKDTGEELWRVPQTEPFTGEMACTACPIVASERLICHTARSVQAFDLSTGDQIWIAGAATTATSTPIVVGNEVIVAAWNKLGEPSLRPPMPSFDELLKSNDANNDQVIQRGEFPKLWIFHRPEGSEAPMNGGTVRFPKADHNRDGEIQPEEWKRTVRGIEKFRGGYTSHGLLAIPKDASGLVTPDQIRTLSQTGIPEVPSPVSDGDHVYLIKNGGLLSCLDLKSGDVTSRVRTRGSGTHYASPLIADGALYTFAGDGRVSVLRLGPRPKVLAVNEMDDGVYATPAIVDGVIYLRTHSAIYAFARRSQ